jgi:hypothetical protein
MASDPKDKAFGRRDRVPEKEDASRGYWFAMILTGAPSSVIGNATMEPTPLTALSLASPARWSDGTP